MDSCAVMLFFYVVRIVRVWSLKILICIVHITFVNVLPFTDYKEPITKSYFIFISFI